MAFFIRRSSKIVKKVNRFFGPWDLQEQLQQLRLGPTVASTPLRTPRPLQGIIEPPTPIIRPTGTIPKLGINRTELDDNYRPTAAQPGTTGGVIAPVITPSVSQLNTQSLSQVTPSIQEP